MGRDYNLEKELGNCEFRENDLNKLTDESTVLCNSPKHCAYSETSVLWKGKIRKVCNYDLDE